MSYLFAIWIAIAGFFQVPPEFTTLTVANQVYDIEVKRTSEEQAKGLSGTPFISDDEGMLFIFDEVEMRSFWMKDMQFALDFLWIANEQVVGISEDIPHPDANGGEVMTIWSPEPADMVFEINAGQIREKGIKVGDSITLD